MWMLLSEIEVAWTGYRTLASCHQQQKAVDSNCPWQSNYNAQCTTNWGSWDISQRDNTRFFFQAEGMRNAWLEVLRSSDGQRARGQDWNVGMTQTISGPSQSLLHVDRRTLGNMTNGERLSRTSFTMSIRHLIIPSGECHSTAYKVCMSTTQTTRAVGNSHLVRENMHGRCINHHSPWWWFM